MGIEVIPVTVKNLKEYAKLPMLGDHRDPNDRLIIAQAISDRVPLISSDRKFAQYARYGLDFIFNER
jgi:PIN domain nuclease of toxin-antitoxin system